MPKAKTKHPTLFPRCSLPSIRPKVTTLGHALVRTGLPVTAGFVHLGPPPRKPLHPAGIDEPEEHDDDAEREARVQRGAERHGVLGPPRRGAVLDQVVEEEAPSDQ